MAAVVDTGGSGDSFVSVDWSMEIHQRRFGEGGLEGLVDYPDRCRGNWLGGFALRKGC